MISNEAEYLNKVIKDTKKNSTSFYDEDINNSKSLDDILLENKPSNKGLKLFIYILATIIVTIAVIFILNYNNSKDNSNTFVAKSNFINNTSAKIETNNDTKIVEDIIQEEDTKNDTEDKQIKEVKETEINNEIASRNDTTQENIDIVEAEEIVEVIETPEPKIEKTKPQDTLANLKKMIVDEAANKKIQEPKVAIVNKNYYIQIGAFRKSPSKSLMRKIEKFNYDYLFNEVTINNINMTKLLIGPFTYAEAKEQLKSIIDNLDVKKAYVLKL